MVPPSRRRVQRPGSGRPDCLGLVLVITGMAVAGALQPQPRIIGGVTVAPFSLTFLVRLYDREFSASYTTSGFCGGSLIARNWVLSAAHCVEQVDQSTGVVTRSTAEDLVVGVHRNKIWDDYTNEHPCAENIRVAELIRHASWDSNPVNANDITLLRLERDVTCADEMELIRLDDGSAWPWNSEAPTSTATVAGWGSYSEYGSSQAEYPNRVDINLYSMPQCREYWRQQGWSSILFTRSNVVNRMLCAGICE